jgi:serine kinase of HPr protein (carbohydrate metabolism regulator)
VIVHAGLLALRLDGRWRGVLVEGSSGCGKSDLALRLLEAGFRLVADDRVLLWTAAGRLFGRAPDALRGLIEVRGQGVLAETALPLAQVSLVARPGDGERMPEPETSEILGVGLPLIRLDYLEASAAAKLRRALVTLYLAGQRRM